MSKDDPIELDLPEGVLSADSAVEVFRAFVADGALHVTFDPKTFSHDAGEWGRLLAESAEHIASAVALDGQMPREAALAAIKTAIDNAFAAAADMPSEVRSGTIQRGRSH